MLDVAERIAQMLKDRGKTLCAAESCTGGMISHMLTSVSGASAWFPGSVVSYSADVKVKLLGVSEETIRANGIVSSKVAAEMAEGVRHLTGADFSVSTTGLAEGGDEHYPEGSVWVGVSGPAGTITRFFQNNGSRKENIEAFARFALLTAEDYISIE